MFLNSTACKLLRLSLGTSKELPEPISDEEWQSVYKLSKHLRLGGVLFSAVESLPKASLPPRKLMMEWYLHTELIKKRNQLLNSEAVRLTQLFENDGLRTVIMKGPANARLYPDPMRRNTGDIDIWVEGGKDAVISYLRNKGIKTWSHLDYHHVQLKRNDKGVIVEVHFRPSSGNYNPITNHRIQAYLENELKTQGLLYNGFYVPSKKFDLVMQLAHIQRHFLGGDVSMRQLVDYFFLLQSSTDEERNEVSAQLQRLGLRRVGGAVMWILVHVMLLDEQLILTEMDEHRGQWMLDDTVTIKKDTDTKVSALKQLVKEEKRRLKMIRFALSETLVMDMKWWQYIAKTMPLRIGKHSARIQNS